MTQSVRKPRARQPVAPQQATPQREMFRELDAALWLSRKLWKAGVSARVFEGITTYTERRERIRRAILEHRLADRAVPAERGERQENFASCFERIFNEPITPGDTPC
jgi:hypothetical protein